MWDRKELKAKGRAAFKGNYWRCVLVAFVLSIFTAAALHTAKGNVQQAAGDGSAFAGISPNVLIAAILGAGLVALVVGALFEIFVRNMLIVGGYRFFIQNGRTGHADLNVLISAYKDKKFLNVFLTMLLRDLFTLLWSLLFIIPGIVKSYSYRMVPYILADDPDMDSMDVIKKSREMMDGQKLNAFVLDLSFIGWQILSAVTGGIVGFFWTNPYKEATDAALYDALKG